MCVEKINVQFPFTVCVMRLKPTNLRKTLGKSIVIHVQYFRTVEHCFSLMQAKHFIYLT